MVDCIFSRLPQFPCSLIHLDILLILLLLDLPMILLLVAYGILDLDMLHMPSLLNSIKVSLLLILQNLTYLVMCVFMPNKRDCPSPLAIMFLSLSLISSTWIYGGH